MEKHIEDNWNKTIADLRLEKTPVLVVDAKIIVKNILRFKSAFPRIKLYYAVKALSDPEVLAVIDRLVDGFDIASLGELQTVQKVSKKSLMFSNPVKIPEHIMITHKAGVDMFAFDSAMELNKIAQSAPGSKVYLRLKVSDYGSAFPLSKKFGADENHAVALFGHATDLGLDPMGVTFHVGSQSENVLTWENAIEKTGAVIARLNKVGFNVSMLDIGGGFPGQYAEETIDFMDLARTINTALKKHIPKSVTLVAEPGRYIVADSAVMVTTVIGRENRTGQSWLYLDTGVFQGLMESLEMDEWKYPIFKLNSSSAAMPHHFTLTGPTCDAQDTIDMSVPLPADIEIGDRICIGSTGAYTVVYGSNFNGFKTPKVVCINQSNK